MFSLNEAITIQAHTLHHVCSLGKSFGAQVLSKIVMPWTQTLAQSWEAWRGGHGGAMVADKIHVETAVVSGCNDFVG